MIRIRPGRNWRLNPAYLAELRSGSNAGAEILDVLGIEVDGVDIAAGVGEARVMVAVDELAQALLRLGEGEPAAQATIGPGPTELVLESRGQDLLLTLVSLAPPARMVASGLLVDAPAMRSAVLHAARSLLLDLLGINPALQDAPVAQRLGKACAELARRPQVAPRPWPPPPGNAKAVVLRDAKRGESLRLQLPPETLARLHGAGGVKLAPLAAHLGQGSLALLRDKAPGLQCEGPIFLLLRNLLADAEALVEAWEAGEAQFTLPFGAHPLEWDLTGPSARAAGWRKPLSLPPLRMAALVSQAARAYAAEALRAHRGDELAADLRGAADALDRHCADLETGDLRRVREMVAAPSPPQPSAQQGPLARGRMRRLVYRQAWSAAFPGATRMLLPGPLLVEQPDTLAAHDAQTGAQRWKAAAMPGAVLRGQDLFLAEPGEALVRLDLSMGEVRWKRRLRGAAHPARLWPLPSGVLRALPGEGLAFVRDAGMLGFRARLPGGAPQEVALCSRVLMTSLASGMLAGLDPADGGVLWKRRCKAAAVVACGARALVLSRETLECIDPASGEPAWDVEVPADARALFAADGAAWLLGGGSVLSFGLHDGAARPPVPLAWARALAGDEEGPVVATGEAGAASRLDGKRWTRAAGDPAGAAPALFQRGVVLVCGAQTLLLNAADGLPLASLPAARSAALAADLGVALLDNGEVAVHRLATHLSLL